MTVDAIERALESHNDRTPGQFWLSVNSRAGFTVEQVAKLAGRRNQMMRVTTAGAIRAAGWHVVETPGRRDVDGHCDVFHGKGDAVPSVEALEALSAAFGPAQENTGRPQR